MDESIPKPKEGDTQKEYGARFMADPEMVRRFPDIVQRASAAQNVWDAFEEARARIPSGYVEGSKEEVLAKYWKQGLPP